MLLSGFDQWIYILTDNRGKSACTFQYSSDPPLNGPIVTAFDTREETDDFIFNSPKCKFDD